MAGDFHQAQRVVDELLAKNPKDPGNLLLKGQLLARDGKRDESFAQLQAAAQLDPNSAALQFALGRSHTSRGDLDQAREAYLAALRQNPRAASAQVELSRLELAGGRVECLCAACTRRSKNRAKQSRRAALALVRSLLVSRDVAGARAVLTPLLDAKPNEAILHVQRGYVSAASNDMTAARRAFVRALELDPRLIDAIAGMVVADIAIRDFSAARARIEAAVKAQPDRCRSSTYCGAHLRFDERLRRRGARAASRFGDRAQPAARIHHARAAISLPGPARRSARGI